MIILLPTAFSFIQTAPFTNIQLDPPSTTTTRLILIHVLYTPAEHSATSLHTTAITMSTSERNPVDIITLHQATILALMEPTIANIREPLTEAELTTYQRFVRKLNESAQAAQEACMAYEALVASKALKKLPAPAPTPRWLRSSRKTRRCSERRREGLRRRGPRPIVLSICIGGRRRGWMG